MRPGGRIWSSGSGLPFFWLDAWQRHCLVKELGLTFLFSPLVSSGFVRRRLRYLDVPVKPFARIRPVQNWKYKIERHPGLMGHFIQSMLSVKGILIGRENCCVRSSMLVNGSLFLPVIPLLRGMIWRAISGDFSSKSAMAANIFWQVQWPVLYDLPQVQHWFTCHYR